MLPGRAQAPPHHLKLRLSSKMGCDMPENGVAVVLRRRPLPHC